MRTRLGATLALAGHAFMFSPGVGSAAPVEFSQYACAKRVDDPVINEILTEIFVRKTQKLADANRFTQEFWRKNKNLGFAICDNRSYDTRVYYGQGVVFDFQMIVYLFAQSRALMVGRYISLDHQFTVHRALVDQFVRQTDALKIGPLEIIKQNAISLGVNERTYEAMVADPKFKERERTLFLLALYFLSMHERCHVGLDHEVKLPTIAALPKEERPREHQKLEMEADACALDVINADESQFDKSPISFFGVMMTIATQAIVSRNLQSEDEQTHPTARERLAVATRKVLAFLAAAGPEAEQKYGPTIVGTSSYFEGLLDAYPPPR